MKVQRIKVKNEEHKIDMIAHVNEDHMNELYEIVYAYTPYKEFESAQLIDLFENGCLLAVEITKDTKEELFVPFTIKGALEEKVLYLAYKAMIANGKPIADGKKQYFEVIDRTVVTKNMVRITVKSDAFIPNDMPGFSYLFVLKKLERVRKENVKNKEMTSFSKLMNSLLLFLFKILSSKQRNAILTSMHKNNRYYTVRKAWKEGELYFAFIDIYIHGQTNGGAWAKSLQKGDVIYSVNEYKEKAEHLQEGKALLVGDETALPAIGAILEQWENPILPHVIVITNDIAEHLYLDAEATPYIAHNIVNSDRLFEDIMEKVKGIGEIDTVWGALEKETSTKLRSYFRKTLQIPNTQNRVIGYWKKS